MNTPEASTPTEAGQPAESAEHRATFEDAAAAPDDDVPDRGTDDADGASLVPDGRLCWLGLEQVVPHPDNPRASLGELSELTRSIRAHGCWSR